jgi:hypothetical protein
MSALSSLFSPSAVVVESPIRLVDDLLWDEELAYVRSAVPKRRAEFGRRERPATVPTAGWPRETRTWHLGFAGDAASSLNGQIAGHGVDRAGPEIATSAVHREGAAKRQRLGD